MGLPLFCKMTRGDTMLMGVMEAVSDLERLMGAIRS
jgi:hypothetical protein